MVGGDKSTLLFPPLGGQRFRERQYELHRIALLHLPVSPFSSPGVESESLLFSYFFYPRPPSRPSTTVCAILGVVRLPSAPSPLPLQPGRLLSIRFPRHLLLFCYLLLLLLYRARLNFEAPKRGRCRLGVYCDEHPVAIRIGGSLQCRLRNEGAGHMILGDFNPRVVRYGDVENVRKVVSLGGQSAKFLPMRPLSRRPERTAGGISRTVRSTGPDSPYTYERRVGSHSNSPKAGYAVRPGEANAPLRSSPFPGMV